YLDLLDALKLDAPAVIGFSMGGWLAAELAVLPGTNFSKLILVDAVGVKIGGPTDRDIADVFGMPPHDATRLLWHDPARGPSTEGLPDEAFETMAVNRIALGLYTWEPYMHNPKLRYRLHRIAVPTLLIWGASDGVVKTDYGQAYAGLIPGARFAVIPEAGHLPHIEQPDAFVSQVLAFTD